MAKVESRGIDHLKPHVLHVALFEDDGTCVEIPVRKAGFDGLANTTQQLAYVREAAEFHAAKGQGWERKRNARRALWDADDRAQAEARFVATAQGFTADGQVRLAVTYHGMTVEIIIPPDQEHAEVNARAEFAKVETKAKAEKEALDSFSVSA